jgi:hypothetical protein
MRLTAAVQVSSRTPQQAQLVESTSSGSIHCSLRLSRPSLAVCTSPFQKLHRLPCTGQPLAVHVTTAAAPVHTAYGPLDDQTETWQTAAGIGAAILLVATAPER